jgi:hypothetical protein
MTRVRLLTKSTKNMYKPESQPLFCSMDQGATETDLIPDKREQNNVNPINVVKFVFDTTLLEFPCLHVLQTNPRTHHVNIIDVLYKVLFLLSFHAKAVESTGFTATVS